MHATIDFNAVFFLTMVAKATTGTSLRDKYFNIFRKGNII